MGAVGAGEGCDRVPTVEEGTEAAAAGAGAVMREVRLVGAAAATVVAVAAVAAAAGAAAAKACGPRTADRKYSAAALFPALVPTPFSALAPTLFADLASNLLSVLALFSGLAPNTRLRVCMRGRTPA